jgi:hypothetical protein
MKQVTVDFLNNTQRKQRPWCNHCLRTLYPSSLRINEQDPSIYLSIYCNALTIFIKILEELSVCGAALLIAALELKHAMQEHYLNQPSC